MGFFDRAFRIAGGRTPLRTLVVRKLLTEFPVGSFAERVRVSGFARPAYAFTLFHAAQEGKALGHKAITAIEVGVAGGIGLLFLCQYRDEIEKEVGIKIHLLGLDAGSGLPPSTDPRDLLYCWPTGSFQMDLPKLEARLAGRARVIIGNVKQTAKELVIPADAPVAAIFYDLDFYSSTRDAFALFDKEELLPRVWCYFDDVTGAPSNSYTDSIGVRAAIKDWNAERSPMESHLSKAYTFYFDEPEQWHEQMYLYHRVDHADYNRCLSDTKHELSLS